MASRLFLGLVFLLYPLLVYVGLRTFDAKLMALLLIVFVGLRLLTARKDLSARYLAVVALLVAAFTWLTGSAQGLLAYPVLVNLALLAIFASSLIYPPSVVERLARLQHPDLPPSGVAYTRKVTMVWCVFFVVNALLSLTTVIHGDRELWALYNGLIAYVLMGVLFAVEYLVRRRVMAQTE